MTGRRYVKLGLVSRPNNRGRLAELRARVLADETLPEVRRGEMASALKSLAKALGRPAEAIDADPTALRVAMKGLTAAMVGMRPGRWRNVQSLVSACLAHFGLVVVQGRIREHPPRTGWHSWSSSPPGRRAFSSLAIRSLLHADRHQAGGGERHRSRPV
jgi:hypothetical protein